ncbi:MAG TPA: hypothetical protein VGI75_09080 [Pirellulales bacterium]
MELLAEKMAQQEKANIIRAGDQKWIVKWLPLAGLPSLVLVVAPIGLPRWVIMWLLAGGIYIGCKWLSWHSSLRHAAKFRRKLA